MKLEEKLAELRTAHSEAAAREQQSITDINAGSADMSAEQILALDCQRKSARQDRMEARARIAALSGVGKVLGEGSRALAALEALLSESKE